MKYTNEEIVKYTSFLNYRKVVEEYTKIMNYFNNGITYTKIPNYFSKKVTCVYSQELEFVKIKGYFWCWNGGYELGRYIGNLDKRDYDRTIYRKKSIYKREYHYQNKIKEANKKFNLNLDGDDQYELFKKLMAIDEKVLEKINKKFKRKRLINVFFLIKKFLNNDDKIQIKLSEKILEFYNEWYDYYIGIK